MQAEVGRSPLTSTLLQPLGHQMMFGGLYTGILLTSVVACRNIMHA